MITREALQSLFGETSIAGIPAAVQPKISIPNAAPGQQGNSTLTKILVIGGILIIGGIIIYTIRENRKEKEKKEFKFKK